MPFGDREVWIIKPTSVVDDVSGLPFDPEKTWVGMQREVAAIHSLGVVQRPQLSRDQGSL